MGVAVKELLQLLLILDLNSHLGLWVEAEEGRAALFPGAFADYLHGLFVLLSLLSNLRCLFSGIVRVGRLPIGIVLVIRASGYMMLLSSEFPTVSAGLVHPTLTSSLRWVTARVKPSHPPRPTAIRVKLRTAAGHPSGSHHHVPASPPARRLHAPAASVSK